MKHTLVLLFSACFLIISACSKQAEAVSTPEHIQVSIKGMTCQDCVNSITSAVTKLPGVTACEVSLEQESASIDFQSGKMSAEKIQKRINQLGYEASLSQ